MPLLYFEYHKYEFETVEIRQTSYNFTCFLYHSIITFTLLKLLLLNLYVLYQKSAVLLLNLYKQLTAATLGDVLQAKIFYNEVS